MTISKKPMKGVPNTYYTVTIISKNEDCFRDRLKAFIVSEGLPIHSQRSYNCRKVTLYSWIKLPSLIVTINNGVIFTKATDNDIKHKMECHVFIIRTPIKTHDKRSDDYPMATEIPHIQKHEDNLKNLLVIKTQVCLYVILNKHSWTLYCL